MDKGRNLFQKSINQEENALRQAEKEINEREIDSAKFDIIKILGNFAQKT